MSKPYIYDLRQKVMQAIKLDDLKISEASSLFSRRISQLIEDAGCQLLYLPLFPRP